MTIKNIPIIDTHFHIWNSNQLEMEWLNLFGEKLNAIYTLQDYEKAIKNHNIVKSCYAEVDVTKEDQRQESDLAIQLCEDPSNQIVGATLGCDLSSSAFENYIKHYATNSHVKAVRHNFFASDPSICTQAIVIENTRLLGTLNIMSDLVFQVESMQYGIDLAKKCPDTTFVIDHCGLISPKADQETRQKWREGILGYASLNNTLCKVSESCALAMDHQWQLEEVAETIKHCVDSFGEDRVVYASNWPVCDITGSIGRWIEALEFALPGYSESFWHQLLHKNAEKFYRL